MTITTSQVKSKLEALLAVLSTIDPHVALAAAGVDALTNLFSANSEFKSMMDQVYAETKETAPDVAQAVSQFYTAQGDALERSFREHPGK